MKKLIVSCLEKVPELAARFRPNHLLSISAVPETPSYMDPSSHTVLSFADIESPISRNIRFAAKPADIEIIRSLKDKEILLINCRLGQRRSPTAALILLWQLFPSREQEWIERIYRQAPYALFNDWMLRLADPDQASRVTNRPLIVPPKGSFFVLDLD